MARRCFFFSSTLLSGCSCFLRDVIKNFMLLRFSCFFDSMQKLCGRCQMFFFGAFTELHARGGSIVFHFSSVVIKTHRLMLDWTFDRLPPALRPPGQRTKEKKRLRADKTSSLVCMWPEFLVLKQ